MEIFKAKNDISPENMEEVFELKEPSYIAYAQKEITLYTEMLKLRYSVNQIFST